MGLHGVTFDWWGTLYAHREMRSRRVELIHDALVQHGYDLLPDQVDAAYHIGAQRFDAEWRARRVYLPRQWLTDTLAQLGASIPAGAFEVLQRGIEDAMLVSPPPLAPGVPSLLADLHDGGIRIGLISDTGLTVGRAMRQILAKHSLLRYFSGFAFSDEVGVTKPHQRAFHSALEQMGLQPAEAVHVGDLLETDIRGARAVGMRAILITGISGRQDDGCADAVVSDFAELRALFKEWGLLLEA